KESETMLTFKEGIEILPASKTREAERQRRIFESVRRMRKDLEDQAELEQLREEDERAAMIQHAAERAVNRRAIERRRALAEQMDAARDALIDLLCENLTEIFYKSIALDEDFKIVHADTLKERG